MGRTLKAVASLLVFVLVLNIPGAVATDSPATEDDCRDPNLRECLVLAGAVAALLLEMLLKIGDTAICAAIGILGGSC